MTINAEFQWQCHPISETILLTIIQDCIQKNPFIAKLEKELLSQTSTRLFDWVDHITIGFSKEIEEKLLNDGFILHETSKNYRTFHHPGAQFPLVVIKNKEQGPVSLAIAVDSIADFLMVRGISKEIQGTFLGQYRQCSVSIENDVECLVVERRGSYTLEPSHNDLEYLNSYLLAKELWKTRPRSLSNEDEAMHQTLMLTEKIIQLVGQDLAAWIVLECERDYWQSHNLAGQLQKNRQDALGMGWANHDHHTFRSSRKHFAALVRLFEMLGFYCRERFYAGKEAGWGAQVMEHPRCRLVLFLDVDLRPEEVAVDFRHQPLPDLNKLHTVGLWCALHGDSILKSGMHHLEAQFMFDELKADLDRLGVGMMEPFSNFPFLKQAFTKAEKWPVDPKRIQHLLRSGLITEEQAQKFSSQGALGSHMENLQRREGYKGFNQKNVSIIIQETDPRNINF